MVPLLAMLLIGCDATIHEHPGVEEPLTYTDVEIIVDIDRNAPLGYKQLTINGDGTITTEMLPEEEMSVQDIGEGYDLNLIVKLYKGDISNAENAETVGTYTFTVSTDDREPSCAFSVSLPSGNYFCEAWADYISDNGSETTFFDESDLSALYSDYKNYPSDTRYRSAAAGYQVFHISADDSQRQVEFSISRPLGRYRIVATDYDSYLTKAARAYPDKIIAQVRYKMYLGIAYDVLNERLVDFIASYSFTADANWADDLDQVGERSLIGDYIFGEPDREVIVLADLSFYDSNYNLISSYSNLKIPIRPNHETVIKGNFLTESNSDAGGIKIDEGFDNEVVIYI